MLRAALVALLSLQILYGSSASAQPGNAHPVLPRPAPIEMPQHPPKFEWQFADIHVTVLGPNIVKIDWLPLAGADQYVVNRNGAQVGPVYPADPAATQPWSATDNNAPANSHLEYAVSASHKTTQYGLPGTPGAGAVFTHETLMQTSNSVQVVTPAAPVPPPPLPGLQGFVDLHTHPMANLGFGGKLLYGGVDVGSLLPSDPDCNNFVRATSEQQALGHDKSTHGGHDFITNTCGDELRKAAIHAIQSGLHGADESEDATGYPNFTEWPVWNDLTHQKMWVEWIRRAYSGGLRVMVALAVNNKTLGDLVAGPGDYPTDDKSSADRQIAEIQSFVGRHPDFMQVAYTSSDVKQIVSANKLAVVVGIEVDHIGNFQTVQNPAVPSDADVKAEIGRLYNEGVRYIFPIHVLDNAFGGTAAYVNLFNVSNVRESGHSYDLVCADASDNITYTYNNNDLSLQGIVFQMLKTGWAVTSISYGPCPSGIGEKNRLALTPTGVVAIKEMMRLGMLIDIDHMSQAAADQAIALAQSFGYPVNSGHNGIRGSSGTESQNERSLRLDQYASIGKLHGMAGVGSSATTADQWRNSYNLVVQTMGSGAVAGFGTDTDGFALAMPPPPKPAAGTPSAVQYTTAFTQSVDGSKKWDYNNDGVAHYGMLSDFLQDVGSHANGKATIDNLMQGAEYFYQTWAIAEAKKMTIGP